MKYDEITISTRREINVCRDAIRELAQTINGLEEKYGFAGADILNDASLSTGIDSGDLNRWRDCMLAVDRWKERLEEHLRIIGM